MVNNDAGNSHDIWTIKDSRKSSPLEYVTPHKICVWVLISEMISLKLKNKDCPSVRPSLNMNTLFHDGKKPIYRRDFCMLILKLIQAPDMEFSTLLKLLQSRQYQIVPELIDNFLAKINLLAESDVGSFPDLLINVDRFLQTDANGFEIISRSSRIGLFLRRIQLYSEKLPFQQTIVAHKAFLNYLSSHRLHKNAKTKELSDSEEFDETKENRPFRWKSVEEMDMSSIAEDTASLSALKVEGDAGSKIHDFSEWIGAAPPVGLWSKKQAELFMSQQAKYLKSEPSKAFPPNLLQSKLKDLMSTNPELAETHYLSYLNCLRTKEYCGAVDSLAHYFDRKILNSPDDDMATCRKGLRYAALNTAILQALFNNKNEALCALTEAITLAHEANDNACLQHAQAWLFKLQSEDESVLIQRSVTKCEELQLHHLYSFGLQSQAQSSAKKGDPPPRVFDMLGQCDVINMQYSMMDLLSSSLGTTAALWSMYGRSDLAALTAQELLHLEQTECCYDLIHGNSVILAVTALVNYFAMQGEYAIAWTLVNHGRQRAPDSKWWLWAENSLYFTESLHKGLWQHAHTAVNQLSTVDKKESYLRLSELLLLKGDKQGASAAASDVLSDCGVNPVTQVRALVLSAKANPEGALMKLSRAMELANYHYIDYWESLIALEIANIQVDMGLGVQALKLVDRTLLKILSHGCFNDMADALSLLSECKVITANANCRYTVIHEAISILNRAAQLAKQIENYCKVKKIVYFQAILCNNIDLAADRNKYAYEFRILDDQHPIPTDSFLHAQQ